MPKYKIFHLCNDYSREYVTTVDSFAVARAWCKADAGVHFWKKDYGTVVANKHREPIHLITRV